MVKASREWVMQREIDRNRSSAKTRTITVNPWHRKGKAIKAFDTPIVSHPKSKRPVTLPKMPWDGDK